jgi:hypothetical protein
MTIKLQNHVFLAIQLLKPFMFDHQGSLVGSFADLDAT